MRTVIELAVVGLVLLALGACAGTRLVETPVAVPIPGAVEYRQIPADLLTCPGKPAKLENGITGGEFIARARGWQAYSKCLEERLKAIEELGAPEEGPPGLVVEPDMRDPKAYDAERERILNRRQWAVPSARRLEV
jgi:hypothetical protein